MPQFIRTRWFEMDQVSGVTVITFLPQDLVRFEDIDEVAQQLYKLLENYSSKKIVLNLSGVRRLSSLMLGKLIAFNDRVTSAGGRMVLCDVNTEVHSVFKAVNLLKVFPICADETAALKSF